MIIGNRWKKAHHAFNIDELSEEGMKSDTEIHIDLGDGGCHQYQNVYAQKLHGRCREGPKIRNERSENAQPM
jgi:hypothetical protein